MSLASRARRLTETDKLRARYVNAYTAANGSEPEIQYYRGWFRIRGIGTVYSNHREYEVRDMCRELENRVARKAEK